MTLMEVTWQYSIGGMIGLEGPKWHLAGMARRLDCLLEHVYLVWATWWPQNSCNSYTVAYDSKRNLPVNKEEVARPFVIQPQKSHFYHTLLVRVATWPPISKGWGLKCHFQMTGTSKKLQQ